MCTEVLISLIANHDALCYFDICLFRLFW